MTQNQRPYKSIEDFRQRVNSDNIFIASAFKGCTEREMRKIESHLNFNLPSTIKEFLHFCGKKWPGTYALRRFQEKLLDRRPYQILEESKLRSNDEQGIKEIDVSEIIIIDFDEHLGDFHWSFFYKKDKNENPDIYTIAYEELEDSSLPFTQYIGNKLEGEINLATRLSISDYRRFESVLKYTYPSAVKALHIGSHELSLKANELINQLPKLEELSFHRYNSFAQFSWSFKIPYHPYLRKISISRAELREVHFPPEGLPNLEFLDICSENLVEIPKDLSSCPNLITLTIREGKFDTVPIEIFNLKKLRELYISNLLSSEFPAEVTSLVQLVRVSLRGNLERFPKGLYALPNLTEIDLSTNIISTIDEEIKNIKNLKKLNISQNSFSDSELEKINLLLPDVQIRNGNQKPYTKPNANSSKEFEIIIDEKIAEKYFAQLEKDNVHYTKGLINGITPFIYTNKYDYQKCLDILNTMKTTNDQS